MVHKLGIIFCLGFKNKIHYPHPGRPCYRFISLLIGYYSVPLQSCSLGWEILMLKHVEYRKGALCPYPLVSSRCPQASVALSPVAFVLSL